MGEDQKPGGGFRVKTVADEALAPRYTLQLEPAGLSVRTVLVFKSQTIIINILHFSPKESFL